jgi:hypothetical protein
LDWNFNGSVENESTLKPLCEQVDQHFQLSAHRIYRYFAVPEPVVDGYLSEKAGEYFRGLHVPVSGTHEDDVRQYLLSRCLPPGSATSYDHLIYIRQSTCLDPTGCVVTYAHELRHIEQNVRFPNVMKANSALYWNLKKLQATATEIDIPMEVDANIASKSIAETVCGVEAVKRFAEEQVRHMKRVGAIDQIVRWEFFLKTPSSTPYDFVGSTLRVVERYKSRLSFGMDVDEPEWWRGTAASGGSGDY